MPVSARDLLNLAKELPTSPEAQRRMFIGRAYYACYHRCRDWEKTLPHVGSVGTKTTGVHQQLIDRLLQPDGSCSRDQFQRSKWLGKRLGSLRDLRASADYRLEDELTEEQTRNHVKLAQAVFNRCDRDRSRSR